MERAGPGGQRPLVPPSALSTHFRQGSCNRVHLKCDCRLRKQSAVRRCERIHSNTRLGQYCSREVGGGADGDRPGGLPENILGLCTACQGHFRASGLAKSPCNLEYPHVIRATGEGDSAGYGNGTGPFVETGGSLSPPIWPAPRLTKPGLVRPAASVCAFSASRTAPVKKGAFATLQGREAPPSTV
jgi:hypothetical protein